jgi:hypothetical protein
MSKLSELVRNALTGDDSAVDELSLDLDDAADSLCDEVEKLEQERDEARELVRRIIRPLERWRANGGLINLDSLAESLDAAGEHPWLEETHEPD